MNGKFETNAIHRGEKPDTKQGFGDVVMPIHLSSTFARREVDKPTKGYEYSRSGNPTRHALEKKLASLENAKYGLAFSSGLAAETAVLISLLKSGDHVIAFDDLYGGTKRLFNKQFKKFSIEFTYADATSVDNVKQAIKKNTKLIWLETPTNPLMKLCDIKAIVSLAKRQKIIVVVDNTFMSPYFQQPLDLSADIVLHSTTKYINGHSDSIGGAVMLNDSELYNSLTFTQNATGAILAPFDCFFVARGIKTLAVRMQKHEENAQIIASWLEQLPQVKAVYYPGLPSHPQHLLAKKQMSGFGGMISFEIKGNLATTKQFLERLRLFAVAESLGGVESLIEHPATMTHASIPKEEREKLGITENLIRVSIGIEHKDDLIADLKQALGVNKDV